VPSGTPTFFLSPQVRMSDWRPLSANVGRRTDVKFDSDGKMIIRSLQNVDPIIDHNKEMMNHGDIASTIGGLARRYAQIPLNIVYQWLVEDGLDVFDPDHQERLARKLNDPDYRYLRTHKGHMGVSNGVAR
jgi:hypothetical protein